MSIPLGKPYVGNEEKEAVEAVIRQGRLATGDKVKELEEALAGKFQRKYCLAVSSGTAALYLGLKALGIRQAIIPSITCEAVPNAVLNAGGGITYADVERDTHNLDLSSLSERQLSEAEAVIVTHTYGHAVDMDKLDYYLDKYNLVLIEDFAQATGGYYKDRILGSFGKFAITSFYATKCMTTGHGGALLTDDEDLYLKCVYTRGSRAYNRYEGLIPLNFQMTDIQAAIGLVQLEKLDMMNDMRRDAAEGYHRELQSASAGLLHPKDWAKHSYYKYAIVLPKGIQKQVFIKRMKDFGIETGKLYDPPLHRTGIAMDMAVEEVELPVAERIASETVSLPMFPGLFDEEIRKVCKAVRSVIADSGGKI